MKFSLPRGPTLTKTKKKIKIQTFGKRKKGSEDMVDSYLSKNLVLIRLMVSEKTRFTYDGQTDGRRTPTSRHWFC